MWGICLKIYETESFVKSFTLFFSIQMFFLSMVMWQYYKSIAHEYDMKIMHDMTQCSFTLECPDYIMEFVEQKKGKELNQFYKEESNYMLFSLPTMDEYRMKLSLSHEKYQQKKEELKVEVLKEYFLYGLILLLISMLFAHYSIRPLKEALELNDEFVKDILHDFNTPISSLKINFKILQKQFGQNESIQRSEQAMNTIADLQSNLTYFLARSPLEQEKLNLEKLIKERVHLYQTLFPHISFQIDITKIHILINRDAFIRIIDNLLSNAGKYNIANGSVKVYCKENALIIEDSGIGIKEPKKIFDRFYKENNRGIGIGLYIVKKLCDDLGIVIEVESQVNKGTHFVLNLKEVMFR